LREGAELETCVVDFTVDDAGEVAVPTVSPGRLAQAHAVGFGDVANVLSNPEHQLHHVLDDAHKLARVLLARRQSMGALAIYDLLHGWATTEEGKIVELAESERNAGYMIVQELMIAANESAARWAAERDIALLFRNHSAGRVERDDVAAWLDVAEDESRLPAAQQHLATMLRPAVYEPVARGHFGLNLPAYTHVTSPLRRYPDLVNQRILMAAAAGRPSPYRLETLDETAAAVNLRYEAARAKKARRFRDAAGRATRGELVSQSYRELDDSAFGKVVRMAAGEQRYSQPLAEEIERRLETDRLLPRDAVPILFDAAVDAWQPTRERLMMWLMDAPEHALTVLSMYAQQIQARLRWDERSVGSVTQPIFEVAAHLGESSAVCRVAPSKKAARQQAALAMIALRCALADPSRDLKPDVVTPEKPARIIPDGHPPVSAVNELAQTGMLANLTWEFASAGSAHEPLHTCTVSAIVAEQSEVVEATASGETKSAAKAAAAAALLPQLPTT
jgi:ribonuclease R